MEDNKVVIIIFVVLCLISALPYLRLFIGVLDIKINAFGILIAALVIAIIWAIVKYNKFVSLKQNINQARGGIDVYLKQRFDLIPNLLETVKGYKDYEKEIIEKITKLRYDFENRNEKDIKSSEMLNDRYTNIIALVENYPELKSNESFLNLQKTLAKIENQLLAARRIYNSEVTIYNTERLRFPSNIIAGMFKFEEEKLFEITVNEKENIEVN